MLLRACSKRYKKVYWLNIIMNQTTINNQYEVELHRQILKVFHESDIKMNDNHFGSKIYTNYQRFGLLVLFVRSKKALRNFTAELFESKWPKWLGLKEIPSYRTIHHWLTKWNISWLREILVNTTAKTKPEIMAIDATGFDSWQRSRHYEQRLKQFGVKNPYLPYAKADLIIDTKTKLVHDFVLRIKPRHDTLGATTMIKRFRHKNVLFLADKGYDSEPLHELIVDSGNLMFAPVRGFKVKRPKGVNRRRCSEGHELYFQRNIIESINFSLKSRFRSLRSKLPNMKKQEFGWQMIAYNLEKLSQSASALFRLVFDLAF